MHIPRDRPQQSTRLTFHCKDLVFGNVFMALTSLNAHLLSSTAASAAAGREDSTAGPVVRAWILGGGGRVYLDGASNPSPGWLRSVLLAEDAMF